MRTVTILAAALALASLPAGRAAADDPAPNDPAANFVTKLFIDACIPNLGRPDQVRAWAVARHLPEIRSQAALDVFVGSGDSGAAWAVPSELGQFALSLRGKTQGCAVWARAADPTAVRAYFIRIIDGVKRPGIEVSQLSDTSTATPNGQARSLAYNVTTPGAQGSFVFMLLTAERAGGPFQVSIEAAAAPTPPPGAGTDQRSPGL